MLISPFLLALISFFLYWLALPQVECWPLIFFVPVCWYPLFYRNLTSGIASGYLPPNKKTLPSTVHFCYLRRLCSSTGRLFTSFYGQLWSAAAIFWMVINFWLTFPHPATSLGWFLLSLYLALYFPFFVFLGRTLNTFWKIPLYLTIPMGWITVEWFRKHLLGGYSFASLEHAFYRHIEWIQTAEWFGEYTVGVFIILLGTFVGMLLWGTNKENYNSIFQTFRNRPLWKTLLLVLLIITLPTGIYLYGVHRIAEITAIQKQVQLKEQPLIIALLQDSTTFSFPVSEEENMEIHRRYVRLTENAARIQTNESKPDLIVWPESCLADPIIEVLPGGYLPGLERLPNEERQKRTDQYVKECLNMRNRWLDSLGVPVILGAGTITLKSDGSMLFYNSAVYRESNTKQLYKYDKVHRVMFGEYLPYAEYLPDSFPLKTLCNSVNAGQGPVAFPLTVHKKNYYLLTNICFESSNPPIIANQVDQLAREGKEPDILINMSNDGWFRMTWQIDMHLATHIFRAVENRKPVLSATHAGLSAGIDPIGRITVEAARGLSGFIEASVLPIKVKRLPRWPWRLPSIILILTLVLTGYSLLPLHRPITSLPTENNECHRHSSGVLK